MNDKYLCKIAEPLAEYRNKVMRELQRLGWDEWEVTLNEPGICDLQLNQKNSISEVNHSIAWHDDRLFFHTQVALGPRPLAMGGYYSNTHVQLFVDEEKSNIIIENGTVEKKFFNRNVECVAIYLSRLFIDGTKYAEFTGRDEGKPPVPLK